MVEPTSSTQCLRSTHARAILGSESHDRLWRLKVLLVGAGGIGCELCTLATALCVSVAANLLSMQ